jgi:enamine deaminase RidA (YjgF/YER057c/UK114 family)
MRSNDVNAAALNGKEVAYFGMPWEDAYGYAQAIKVDDTIHVSGQLSHDENGSLIAPAVRSSMIILRQVAADLTDEPCVAP